MKFYSKKNLDNPNVTIKNKETNINRIETEKNMFYGKPPNYSLKDINNPLVKFDIDFNEDIYIKKFVALKKINYNGPLKELYEKYQKPDCYTIRISAFGRQLQQNCPFSREILTLRRVRRP